MRMDPMLKHDTWVWMVSTPHCNSREMPESGSYLQKKDNFLRVRNVNEYLFTVTGVEKMKWFLSLMMCDFQPRVTEGHEFGKKV